MSDQEKQELADVESQLSPCPFCGDSAYAYKKSDGIYVINANIECNRCSCSMNRDSNHGNYATVWQLLIKEWNTRTPIEVTHEEE